MPAKLLSDPKNRVLVLDFVDKNHGQSLKPVLSLVVLSVSFIIWVKFATNQRMYLKLYCMLSLKFDASSIIGRRSNDP